MKNVQITTPRYGFAFTQEHLDIADDLCAQAERDLVRRVGEALEREVERLMFGCALPSRLPFLVTGPDRSLYQVHPRHSFGVVRTDIA